MTTVQQPAPTFEDVWRMFQETDRKFQETDLKFQETDRKMQETDRLIQETDRQIQETDKIVKRVSKQLGDLGNRLGEFVEYMVAPAVVRLFRAQGIEVHEVYQGVTAKRAGEALEIDLLVVNDGVLVGVECKSKLTREYVDEHLARMAKLKRVLPLYHAHRVLGAVAAMVIPDSVQTYAMANGLYVLCQNGEQVEVRNPEGFEPAAW
ncbi:DUF3782 domain-containing protein [Thiocystis violacea]|uniref:DUF3782 domain-containing protein n=1 Tax=Thiocystis violacea TaxID=13725 RepID=UPI0019057C5F|nr:DUF3782 domain-containing protein [Thiocystis violacea]MBK1717115.1 DUF3782 domain-containing protein [Thiocystis violacea]